VNLKELRKHFDNDDPIEAVLLRLRMTTGLRSNGKLFAEIAPLLGVQPSTLHEWAKLNPDSANFDNAKSTLSLLALVLESRDAAFKKTTFSPKNLAEGV
jgi:hypothetical protein